MNPDQNHQLGWDDQVAGRTNDALFNDPGEAGRSYREGRRAARRAAEEAQQTAPAPVPEPEKTQAPPDQPLKEEAFFPEIPPAPPADPSGEGEHPEEGLEAAAEEAMETAGDEDAEGAPPAAPGELTMDGDGQFALFDHKPAWTELWKGMPEFDQRDLTPWQTIPVHFACRADRVRFAQLIGQTITDDTRSLWFPKQEIGRFIDKRWVTPKRTVMPRHPIYVISKGRWDSRLTVKALESMGLPYHVVIEPQELEKYAAVIAREKILVLPFSNLGQGSIPARNWVWEHAISRGAERHWILDDNIDGFFRLHNNLKVPVKTGATFKAAEDFVDRYENVAMAGMQYFMFASRKTVMPPLTLNTRIYSCILIRNDIQHRWRGRYNEDTDLSLRVLKDGHCTVLFNAFLAFKMTTMTMSGGNTEALYKIKEGEKDGRLLMAESLKEQHPELVQITWKWGRWQHHVNYKVFKQKLRPRLGVKIPEEPDNYGMELEYISDEERKNGAGK